MAFSLGKGIIGNKLREEMYLRHLREVEKINNREADSLKKELKEYRSINELHKHNKVKASKFKHTEEQRRIEEKNKIIQTKIKSMESSSDLKHSLKREHPPCEPAHPGLHYRYRKKQQ